MTASTSSCAAARFLALLGRTARQVDADERLYGLHQPDEGEIRLNGEPVKIDSPRRAINLGIGMVHQHFMLVPVMTVAENLVLGAEPRNGLLLDYKTASKDVRELSERFGLAVDPEAKVQDLGVGAQQRVEILRALFRGAKVLVLDEPTAVLTAQEAQDLFEVLRALKADGHGDRLHQPQAQRGARRRRPHHGPAPRREDRHGARRGRDRGEPRAADGRAATCCSASTRPAKPASRCSRSATSRSRRPRPAARSRRHLRGPRGEIVGLAGVDGNGQSSSSRRSPACARRRRAIRIAGHDVTAAACARRWRPARPHRRGPPPARARARLHARREPRAARVPQAADVRSGCSRPKRMREHARRCSSEYDVRGGDPRRAPRRCRAATSRRS
jgi:simple sugar transport system ATP-binding protein